EGRIAVGTRADGTWVQPTVRATPLASDDLHTTAADYARLLVSLMSGEGLTPALLAERGRVQADRRAEVCAGVPSCPDEVGAALGWEIVRIGATRYFMHTGRDEGTFTFAWWSPELREGSVILTSSDRGAEVVLPLLEVLAGPAPFLAYLRA